MDEDKIKKIVKQTTKQFPSFGGGEAKDSRNPIAVALKDHRAQFAMGVDIETVVRFVLSEVES